MNCIEQQESLINDNEFSSSGSNTIRLSSHYWFLTVLVILSLVSCSASGNDEVTPASPTNCTYIYSSWSACSKGKQTRTLTKAEPEGCAGTPVLEQTCVVTASSCTFIYSEWSARSGGKQTRTVTKAEPEGCAGTPVLEQACEVANLPPSAPAFSGNTSVMVNNNVDCICTYSIVVSSTDVDGSVATIYMVGGSLPSGISFDGTTINGSVYHDSVQWPVNSSWVAIDNLGLQSAASNLALTCTAAKPCP